MPELIEVEYYRRSLDPVLGQTLRSVRVDPKSFLRPAGAPTAVFDPLLGATLTGTSRRGKLLLLHLTDADGQVGDIGLRFGMTGRLLIDGRCPIEYLEYSSKRNDAAWDRAVLDFAQRVAVRDQRRLGAIEVDPSLDRLGPEATTLDSDDWRRILSGRRKSIKGVLLDQSLIAGFGNLLSDELLWRCGLDPNSAAGTIDESAIERLTSETVIMIEELTLRGGSHTGDSFALRQTGALCSRCGVPMEHATVATRSTWWCRGHQR